MVYSIYRNAVMIGEKNIEFIESQYGVNAIIEIDFGSSAKKIEVFFDNERNIKWFNVCNNKKNIEFRLNKNIYIHSNQRLIVDEILINCFENLKINNNNNNAYFVFSTDNFNFFQMKFYKKESGKYNILVPTYAYLEYNEDGFLEYLEDYKNGLQIIME